MKDTYYEVILGNLLLHGEWYKTGEFVAMTKEEAEPLIKNGTVRPYEDLSLRRDSVIFMSDEDLNLLSFGMLRSRVVKELRVPIADASKLKKEELLAMIKAKKAEVKGGTENEPKE